MQMDEPVEASSGLAKAATLTVPRHEQRSVPDVAKHDGEEEGEADDREDARVDLAVSRDAVSVDERLEAPKRKVRELSMHLALGARSIGRAAVGVHRHWGGV